MPTHEYYTFGGWYTQIGGGGYLFQNEGIWNIDDDITLYAYWLGTPGLNYVLNNNTYEVSKGSLNAIESV